MRRFIHTASLAALATVLSTAAFAHPGLPGHIHDADGAVVYPLSSVNTGLAMAAVGALAAAVAFVFTVLGCLLLFPDVTRTYYGTLLGDAERIGPVEAVINQSLRGTLSRFVGFDVGSGWIWMVGVLVAVVVAVFAGRAVSDALGILLVVQLFGLLVSPISWVHHWVWIIPLGIWLVHGTGSRRRGARVLIGDPGRTYFPRSGLDFLAEYRVPTTRQLEDQEIKRSSV